MKAAATVVAPDFRGLERLRNATDDAFALGVVLYDGEQIVPLGVAVRRPVLLPDRPHLSGPGGMLVLDRTPEAAWPAERVGGEQAATR